MEWQNLSVLYKYFYQKWKDILQITCYPKKVNVLIQKTIGHTSKCIEVCTCTSKMSSIVQHCFTFFGNYFYSRTTQFY